MGMNQSSTAPLVAGPAIQKTPVREPDAANFSVQVGMPFATGQYDSMGQNSWRPGLIFSQLWNASILPAVATETGGLENRPSEIRFVSAAQKVLEIYVALSVNKSDLARILRVSRPTVYDWLNGGEPNLENQQRISVMYQLINECKVSSIEPLMPTFIRQPGEHGEPPLIDELSKVYLNENAIRRAIQRVQAVGESIRRRREKREARLREAGFEEVDAEHQRANIARNIALLNWPRY